MEHITTQLIDGKQIAAQIYQNFPKRLAKISYVPVLADIVVGDDPVSLSYVRIKKRTAKKHGLDFHIEHLPSTSTLEQIQEAISRVQEQQNMRGVIVQLPMPAGIDQTSALSVLKASVDVDCIGPHTNEAFYNGRSLWMPPTAGAIWEILQTLPVNFKTASIAVVGQGELVGRPITYLLQHAGCKVVVATKETQDLPALLRSADIVISGTGQGGLITQEHIKHGVILIDAGTSESGAGIVGDVNQNSVLGIAGMLSPVPGGVGPVTVAKLLDNVLTAAEHWER